MARQITFPMLIVVEYCTIESNYRRYPVIRNVADFKCHGSAYVIPAAPGKLRCRPVCAGIEDGNVSSK